MSFIFENKQLIDQLTVAATKHLEKFGQNANINNYNLANKLLIDLQRQVDPQNSIPVESPLSAKNQFLSAKLTFQVKNLVDFINWAAQNQINWKGVRFAWSQNEQPPQNALKFIGKDFDRERDESNQVKGSYAYALKDELIAVLKYLRDSEENRTNKLLQDLLSGLISEANSQLKLSDKDKIGTTPEEKKEVSTLDPNIIVDGLPGILDVKKPYIGLDQIQGKFQSAQNRINVSMLNNPSIFRRLILQTQVKDKDGNLFKGEQNICLALHVLYLRATHLYNTVKDAYDDTIPNYSKATKLYLDKITELGRSSSCALTSPDSGSPTTGQGTAEPSQAALSNLANLLPLKNDVLDFQRIENFFTEFNKFGSNQSGNIQQLFNKAKELMKLVEANKTVKTRSVNFITDLDLINPPSQNKAYFIENVRQLLGVVSGAIDIFKSLYGSHLQGGALDELERQQKVYYQNNKSALSMWARGIGLR